MKYLVFCSDFYAFNLFRYDMFTYEIKENVWENAFVHELNWKHLPHCCYAFMFYMIEYVDSHR